MDDWPELLYKYYTPERWDNLKACVLAYQPLSSFNDPFEGHPVLTELVDREGVCARVLSKTPRDYAVMYAALPSSRRMKTSFESFKKLFDSESEQFVDRQIKNQQASNLPRYRAMLDANVGLHGALCLCEIPDSLLMWAYYARSHTGFVVAYDARHPHFQAARGPLDNLRHLRRVRYRSARPVLKLDSAHWPDLFLTKSEHWQHEKEWRILRPLSEADGRSVNGEQTIHLFSHPPELVRAVILGARATAATESELRSILASNPGYSNVRLQKVYPDPDHFLVQIQDVER